MRPSCTAILAGVAIAAIAAIVATACGGQQRQDATEPSGVYPVQVTAATFPSPQRLAERSRLIIAVRNAGAETIPDIAVTITSPGRGTSVQAFQSYDGTPGLASHSRPVWIVDRPPGCTGAAGSSCESGGAGAAVTAYANTWALGPLQPGATARFRWALTAVTPGRYAVRYEIAAGLNGKARARLAGGGIPKGTFAVRIVSRPQQSYVDGNGNVVTIR